MSSSPDRPFVDPDRTLILAPEIQVALPLIRASKGNLYFRNDKKLQGEPVTGPPSQLFMMLGLFSAAVASGFRQRFPLRP